MLRVVLSVKGAVAMHTSLRLREVILSVGILLSLSQPLVASDPDQITTFQGLMSALESGREVRTVIYYAKCAMLVDSVETASPDAIGGMKLDTYEYFAPGSIGNPVGFLTASETKLISHPSRGHVYNYVKLRIFENGRVEITARYLSVSSMDVVMDEKFHCTIDSGDGAGGVKLFTD